MQHETCVLVVDDDDAHSILIQRNLRRAGIEHEVVRFRDGQAVLDFLFREGVGPHRDRHRPYLILLDIRMPRVDGLEVLRRIKCDGELRKLPVVVLSTTNNPVEIEQCYQAGCNSYVVKPVEYDRFVEAVTELGEFLKIVQIPQINGAA